MRNARWVGRHGMSKRASAVKSSKKGVSENGVSKKGVSKRTGKERFCEDKKTSRESLSREIDSMKALLAGMFASENDTRLELRNVTTGQKIIMASMIAAFMIAAMYLIASV